MTRHAFRETSRLTIAAALAISFARTLPAQGTTQYGPFRITAGTWHDIGLRLRAGEAFYVQANGLMQFYNQQFWPNGFTLQNGNIAGKLHALSGTTSFPVGAAGGGTAQVDGNLELGVLFAPQINNSDAQVTNGAFYVFVTAPAGRCTRLDCGFTNGTGGDLSGAGPGAGNVSNWSPNLSGILTAGYQLGVAEVGAVNRPNNDETLRYVDERLRSAMASAESAPLDARAFGSLVTLLGQTRNAASIVPQMTAVGDGYQQNMSRTCVCGGVTINPSWLFNAGRQLAYAEAATYLNLSPNVMYGYLTSLRTACANTGGILPVNGIEGLMQMLSAGSQPSGMAAAMAAPRELLFRAAERRCVCY